MGSIHSSVDSAALNAWRGQLAATGVRRRLRAQLVQHRHELLPRFAARYRRLCALPRQVRKALQRRWGSSLAGVALTLTLQPLPGEAANFMAGTAAELVTAITTANGTVEADTITLTADITLSTANDTTYIPIGLPRVRSAITIAGAGHMIQREASNPNQFCLMMVAGTGNMTLQDTTLSGGLTSNRGGGLFNYGQLTLEKCTVSGNSAAGGGGGVYNRFDGTVTISNSTITGNTGGGDGGGGVDSHGVATIENSTVNGNHATRGGGVWVAYGELSNSTVSGNTAEGRGGGVAQYSGKLSNSIISGNTAGGDGGGVMLNSVGVSNSTVSDNTAGGIGGGILLNFNGGTLTDSTVSANSASTGGGVYSRGSLTIANSTVSGNSATDDGGGVMLRLGRGELTNSTFSGNTAGRDGGGLFLNAIAGGGVIRLLESTVSGNTGVRGGGIFSRSYPSAEICFPCYRNPCNCGSYTRPAGGVELIGNLLSGNLASTGAEAFHEDRGGSFSVTSNLFGHDGLTTAQALSGVPTAGDNIIATSDGNKPTVLAAILDTTLQDNGGLTLTQNLVVGSPAIDAAGATCDLTTDQRGEPRPVDGNGDGVAACDIGAVEFGSFPSSLDCSTATASVNFPRLGNRHRYPVTISGVTDAQGDPVSVTITSIFQDEPVINPTGKTCPDGIGVSTDIAKVRNERLLAGDGRVYHIGFTATDEAGESCVGEVEACVPAKEGEACGDQGALFDSTVCPSQS